MVFQTESVLKISLALVNYIINKPQHRISNNVVCATTKPSDQPAHMRSLIRVFDSGLNNLSVKLITEHHLKFLSLK